MIAFVLRHLGTGVLAATILLAAHPTLAQVGDAGSSPASGAGSIPPATAQGSAVGAAPPQVLFQRLKALAESGDADVLYNLGMFLNNGLGTARDNPAAFERFQQAADRGHLLAAYKVGCYHAGQFKGVVPFDEAQALQYKLRAAQAGYSLAQWDVGLLHARRADFLQARHWWEQASRQGEVPATVALAHHLVTRGGAADQPLALALMQILKDRQVRLGREFDEHWSRMQGSLSEADKAEAEQLRAQWPQTPSALTQQARAGVRLVPELLARVEAGSGAAGAGAGVN